MSACRRPPEANSRVNGHEQPLLAGSCQRESASDGQLNAASPTLAHAGSNSHNGSIARGQPTRMKDRDASAAILREPPLTAPFVATPGDRSAPHQQPRSFDRRCR